MSNEFFTNVVQFLILIFSLTVIAGIFAVVLYLLFRGRLDKIQTLTVTTHEKALPGVPFYIKKGRLIHETAYLETLGTYILTAKKVTLDADKKPIQSEIEYTSTKTVSLSTDNSNQIARIHSLLAQAQIKQSIQEQVPLWNKAKENFDNLPPFTGQLPDYQLPLEQNILIDSHYVDYDTTIYLNKLQPLSGSSEINIELAADGTLTKTTAKSEDNTFEKLIGLLPVDKLADKLTLQPPPEEESEVEKAVNLVATKIEAEIYEFSLTTEHRFIRHIRSCEVESFSDRTFKPPLPLLGDSNWYRREIITDPKSEPEKPASEPAEQSDVKGK